MQVSVRIPSDRYAVVTLKRAWMWADNGYLIPNGDAYATPELEALMQRQRAAVAELQAVLEDLRVMQPLVQTTRPEEWKPERSSGYRGMRHAGTGEWIYLNEFQSLFPGYDSVWPPGF